MAVNFHHDSVWRSIANFTFHWDPGLLYKPASSPGITPWLSAVLVEFWAFPSNPHAPCFTALADETQGA